MKQLLPWLRSLVCRIFGPYSTAVMRAGATLPRPGLSDDARMQEHSEQLGAIFALSPDGFVSFDRSSTINHVSPAFVRLTGLDESQVLGLDAPRFTRVLRAGCMATTLPDLQTLHNARSNGESHRHLVRIERPTRRVLEVTSRQGNGAAISQVLQLRDVTHETEVDQLKSEFLSAAAHELRTPMTSIYGFCELMMHRELSPLRQQEVITAIHCQTSVMISIVNELLDLAYIESRRGMAREASGASCSNGHSTPSRGWTS